MQNANHYFSLLFSQNTKLLIKEWQIMVSQSSFYTTHLNGHDWYNNRNIGNLQM